VGSVLAEVMADAKLAMEDELRSVTLADVIAAVQKKLRQEKGT
jgi:hypothetical protein